MYTCIEIILMNEHLGNPIVFQCDSDEIEDAKAFAKSYRQKNGYSYKKDSHVFSIKDIVLRERTYTGHVIKDTPYKDMFTANSQTEGSEVEQ